MSWCDKLASTPTVGFRLDPHIASGDTIMDALSPVLSSFVSGDKLLFEMERHDTLGVAFNTQNGFRYGIDHSSIAITFNHRLKAVPVSGGVPALEMLSEALPFTKLLPDSFGRLMEATSLLPNVRNRALRRVGAVSTTVVSEEDLPPGIRRLIDHLGRPWGGRAEHLNYSGKYVLAEQDEWVDSCVHTINTLADHENLLQIAFDWGRVFKNPRAATRETLKTACASAEKNSLEYFEELAEGTRFDEPSNSATV